MDSSKTKRQESKEKYGTLTATQDANNDYSSSTSSTSSVANKNQARKTSKEKYGTLTATQDANSDYQ